MWNDVYAISRIYLFELIKEEFCSNADEEMKDAFTSIREKHITREV